MSSWRGRSFTRLVILSFTATCGKVDSGSSASSTGVSVSEGKKNVTKEISGMTSAGTFVIGDKVTLSGGYDGVQAWLSKGNAAYGRISRIYQTSDAELPEFRRSLARTQDARTAIEIAFAPPVSVRGQATDVVTVILNTALNDSWAMKDTQHADPVVAVIVKQAETWLEVESHATLSKR